MKVLVTGSGGYIGSVLCGKLLEDGFEVTGLDTGFYVGCNFFKVPYTIRQISKDVRDIAPRDIIGFDAVIHLAALSNDPIGTINPELTSEINFRASVRLAEYAREAGVKRFIFSSSCSIYGIAGEEDVDERGKLDPVTEYARSKVESEEKIAGFADEHFSPVILRNATVYGISPMMRTDLVVNNLAGWAYTTGKMRIMSDGTPWRPLIHIQDICNAFIAVLKAPRPLIHDQVFNVGSINENYRIKDIVDIIKKKMPECDIEYTGEHGADERTYRVNFSKITKVLADHFKPQWNVDRGVEEIFAAYKEKKLLKDDFQGDKFIRLKRIKKLLKEGKINGELFWEGGNL